MTCLSWLSRRYWVSALCVMLSFACADHTTLVEVDTHPSLQPVFQELGVEWRPIKDSIGPRQLDLPPENTSLGDEIASLRPRVDRQGGRVMIGLKPSDALRTMETGVVPGISLTSWEKGMAALLTAGVQITRTMRNFAVVVAVIDADSVESPLEAVHLVNSGLVNLCHRAKVRVR